jgi:hypothetical protein
MVYHSKYTFKSDLKFLSPFCNHQSVIVRHGCDYDLLVLYVFTCEFISLLQFIFLPLLTLSRSEEIKCSASISNRAMIPMIAVILYYGALIFPFQNYRSVMIPIVYVVYSLFLPLYFYQVLHRILDM